MLAGSWRRAAPSLFRFQSLVVQPVATGTPRRERAAGPRVSEEDALDELMKDHGGFNHNAQSLRVVDTLEKGITGVNAEKAIEEAYEVADAIERQDYQSLKDELGDLLFQIVFYSQLGQEHSTFNFDDVVQGICEKMIRRHPHIFEASEPTTNSDETPRSWEAIKAEELCTHEWIQSILCLLVTPFKAGPILSEYGL